MRKRIWLKRKHQIQSRINLFFFFFLLYENNIHPLKKSKCIIFKITLHTIASVVRLGNLKDATIRACDAKMIYQLEQVILLNNAVYNAA